MPLGNAHGPRLAVEACVEAQRARAPTDMRGLRLEDGAGVTAPLQLEARAEASQARAQNHHVHVARGLGDGAEIVQRRETEGRPRRDAEAAQELSAGERGAGVRGMSVPRTRSREGRGLVKR